MRTPIIHLFCALMLIGCKNGDKLTFEPIFYTENECADCPNVSISIPKALEKTKFSSTINKILEEEVISLLIFDDEIEASSIDGAILSFKNGYLDLKRLYPDEATAWKAKIDGLVTYEDKRMLTIELKSYLFTGGAHGYSSKRFLNFDKLKGKELENRELFKDQDDFEHFAEIKFRIQEGIPQGKPINSTGFMFEKDSFYLPENIGFTEKGLELLYNQYEVASYADGAITLTLPHDEVKKYLSGKIKS